MATEHSSIKLLKRFNPADIPSSKEIFSDNLVWHYYNPNLPELQGDYIGLNGIQSFFQSVGKISQGTFKVEPVSITPVGDELVVVHARDTLTFNEKTTTLDVVVVWRIVDARIVEVWDIVPEQTAEISESHR